MTDNTLLIGAPEWLVPAAVLGTIALVAALIAYARAPARFPVRFVSGALRVLAILLLIACLIEPLVSARRPREGANTFVLLTDNSQSLTMRDSGDSRSRGERLARLLRPQAAWNARLRQDFDVRWYAFDNRLRSIDDIDQLTFAGTGSALDQSLATLADRYGDRPVSGILLLTDGLTPASLDQLDVMDDLPPIYPVLIGNEEPPRDLRIASVGVNLTNFEATPVTVVGEIDGSGFADQSLTVQLRSEAGEVLESRAVAGPASGLTSTVRFEFRPASGGVQFYELRAFAEGEESSFEDGDSKEATLVNNRKSVAANRDKGPYPVLYVTGRPNWEFKFLRRALEEDAEVELVGLIRIAKREAKFDFRGHLDEDTNPLYRGFDNQDNQQAEQYDEPVLLRVGTRDESELRHGFPRDAEELFAYNAIILDDVEAEFFTRDQLSLVQEFVSRRGGGLLMLGGQESFADGGYRHTPIAEMLPVYLHPSDKQARQDRYRLLATREGMLQPWTRLRGTEEAERGRINAMPPLHVMNRIDSIKPGATVLNYARDSSGEEYPALVAQPFGSGRALALTIGDLWRWGLRRKEDQPRDMDQAWRQTVRWLVADVPKRVDVKIEAPAEDPHGTIHLRVTARDAAYHPLDNASVRVEIDRPQGAPLELTARPSDTEAGLYEAQYVPDVAGNYRAQVRVTAADGSDVGQTDVGWTSDPAQAEFDDLRPRRALFQELARQTGGEMINPRDLNRFVTDLPNRKNVVTEPWIYPFWHQWWILSAVVTLLIGEWTLRRWKGLA